MLRTIGQKLIPRLRVLLILVALSLTFAGDGWQAVLILLLWIVVFIDTLALQPLP